MNLLNLKEFKKMTMCKVHVGPMLGAWYKPTSYRFVGLYN